MMDNWWNPVTLAISETVALAEANPGTTLSDSVYQTLKQRILTCRLAPGQRILERDVSSELRVSRTPLREALHRLTQEGLVRPMRYRGFSVTSVTLDAFRKLCEVRRVVEPATAALAAERATPDDVARIRSCARLSYVPGDRLSYEAYLRANCEFHLNVVRCAGNRDLESIVTAVIDKMQRPLYLGLGVGIDFESSSQEHFQIVDAVEQHNPERARQLMLKHAGAAEERIMSALRIAGY